MVDNFGLGVSAPPHLQIRNGLLASLIAANDGIPEDGEKGENGWVGGWSQGLQFFPDRSTYAEGFIVPICGPVVVGDITPPAIPDRVHVDPFAVVTELECDVNATGLIKVADRVLKSIAPAAVETQFSSNFDGIPTPYLQDPATCVDLTIALNGGAVVSAARGAQQLAQYLAAHAGLAFFHSTPATFYALKTVGLIDTGKGPGGAVRAELPGGHRLINGQGYNGLGPGGIATGDPDWHWLYATGPVIGRTGTPSRLSLIIGDDRKSAVARVGQKFAAYFNPTIHAGVLVDTSIL